jgi:hypothetical protein
LPTIVLLIIDGEGPSQNMPPPSCELQEFETMTLFLTDAEA